MISSLQLNGFTVFDKTEFTFSPGINIFIGKNGTGKTHILKCIAASLAAVNEFKKSDSQAKDKFEGLMADKLKGFFKPEQLGRLVKRQQGRNNASVRIIKDKKQLEYSFATNSKTSVKLEKYEITKEIKSLYIPPREMFSLYEGFLSLIDNREVSFDETYVMLAKSLHMPILKGPRESEARDLVKPFEAELKKVIKDHGRFYIQDNTGKMEAHLVAEGLRKLASIMYLILNGELTRNSVLFWDEPESNLNPALISKVVDFIQLLAQKGVQIFIASHDYLLTHRLSLDAEYKKPEMPDIKFFSLYKNESGETIQLEEGGTLIELENNSILDEYAAYYDLQQKYMNQQFQNMAAQ